MRWSLSPTAEEAVRQAAPLPALLAEAQKAAAEVQGQSTVSVVSWFVEGWGGDWRNDL